MGLSAPAPLGRRRRRGGAFRVPQLFANGEAGAWYDPSDLTAEKVAWRRNLLTWSEDFTNAAWTKTRSSITPNAGTSWDGTATASKLVEDSSTGTHFIRQDISVTAGIPYAVTMYAKAAERSVLFISPDGGSNFFWFDLSNGTTGGSASGSSAIESVGSGWYRCIYLRTYTTTTTAALFFYVSNSTAGVSYTGDGTSGILIDSAQAQQSATATAYQRITDFTSDFLAAFPNHTLYQDSAGTTPVTALGQPVGLALDTSRGGLASLGSNTVTGAWENGWTTAFDSFASTTTGFTGSTTGAKSNIRVRVPASLVAGRTYAVEFTVTYTNVTLGTINFADTGYSGINVIQSPCTALSGVPYRCIFTASAGAASVMLLLSTSGAATVTLSAFAVREVPGVHAIQPTSASRPLLDGRVNLLTFSEQFDNAVWTAHAIGLTVSANNAVGPDGATTADRIVETATTGLHVTQQQVAITAGATYRIAVFAKAAERTIVQIATQLGGWGTNFYANFDLANGTAHNQTAASATIQPFGNGWYLCAITATSAGTGTPNISFGPVLSTSSGVFPSYAGNASNGLLLVGADFRLAADAAYPYQRVTTATDYADVGVPRSFLFDGFDDSLYTASNMDFATVTSDGLARRNLLSNPSQFDVTASWTLANPGTLTANTDVAPDGTTTASTVTDNITGNFTAIRQTVTVANNSQQYVGSAFLKKTTGATTFPGLVLLFSGGTGKSAALALNTNTGIATARTGEVPDTIAVTDAGAYWRVQWTVTNNASGNTSLRIEIVPAVNTDAGATWSATTTGSTVAWGAQLETGATATAFQNIGTDKVTVLAGVRKLSDAARGIVAELSATTASNNGSFRLAAPEDATFEYSMTSRGTADISAFIDSAVYAAPNTSVITGIGNISGDVVQLRINAAVIATNTIDQGTGNFGSYVLFIGRRNNATAPLNGKAYQLIVRGALTDAATLVQAERFVAQRTGITL